MRQWAGLVGLALFICSVTITIGSCAADDRATDQSVPNPDDPVLQPVPLPDLAHMTVPVREQIRERYALLTSAIESPDTTSGELSNAYGRMGNVLMAARYVDATEPFYLNAQALAPNDRRWPYYLGHLYKTQGAFAKAVASFEKALALQADDVPTTISLGEVRLEHGQPEVAEALFTRALSLEPSSIWARVGLGRASLTSQDYIQAVDHLEEALALDQEAAGIHYPLGMAYRGLGAGESRDSPPTAGRRQGPPVGPVDARDE